MRVRGYTLVELLAVIGIVVVLASLVFAAGNAVKRRAQHTACAENLHNLGVALFLYANDHDGMVPPATTAETYYRDRTDIPPGELAASPGVLRAALEGYSKNDDVWFCPADPYRKTNVLWLGQRHLLTSYYFFPFSEEQRGVWPPAMQIGRDRSGNAPAGAEDVPLFSDAVGIPRLDSDPQFQDEEEAASNHPDRLVNAIRHDLSLSRKSASSWMGQGK